MVMFKWHSAGSDSCFNCMRWNGRIFQSLETVPELPVHPHCQCFIEVLGAQDDKELNMIGMQLKAVRSQIKEGIGQFESYISLPYLLDSLISAAKVVLRELSKMDEVTEIFWRNYEDMEKANTINADKYFHAKANAEASQLGKRAEAKAKLISDVREWYEKYTNVHFKHMSLKATIEDMRNDQRANYKGRVRGRQFPESDPGDLVEELRPNGLDEKY